MTSSSAAAAPPIYVPYAENQCEVRTTPLRALNANLAVLYIALAAIAAVITWFSSTKTGAATFDSNIYRLVGRYAGNYVVPPAGTASLVNLTPQGLSLVLLAALVIGALFHAVYALDCRRLYTLLLVDRCNGMRWAQFAVIHTLIALVVAQMTGTATFDFMWFGLLGLPILGVLGYFADRAYPCCPIMVNMVIFGTAIVLLAYWVPVITNFWYRCTDTGRSAPAYMWIALVALGIFDILLFASPFIQARQRISYFIAETTHTIALLILSTVILVAVGWALADQTSA